MNDITGGGTSGPQTPATTGAAPMFELDPGDALTFDSKAFEELMRPLAGVTIYIREPDLTYFRVEEWEKAPTLECYIGEGEQPFLYGVLPRGDGKGKKQPELYIALVKLVEFLHRTTGTGLGIMKDVFFPDAAGSEVKATVASLLGKFGPGKPPPKPSGLQYDLKIGRRYRYSTRTIGEVLWIERVELGRQRSAGGPPLNHPGLQPHD